MDHNLKLPDVPSRIFFVSGLVLIAFGIGEISSSSLLLQTSHGHFTGSIYTGIFSIILGIRVLVIKTVNTIYTTMVFFLLNLILCIVGTTLSINAFYFLHSIEACAAYSPTTVSSCQTDRTSNYWCYGSSTYYQDAQFCEATYIYENGIPDVNAQYQQCACVRSPANYALSITNTPYSANTCYSYKTLQNCNDLFTRIPEQLRASVLLNIFLLVFTILLGLYAMYLYIHMVPKYQRKKMRDEEVERNLHEYHRSNSNSGQTAKNLTVMLQEELDKVLEDENRSSGKD